MLGVLCRVVISIVVRRVGLLTSPLRLVVSSVPTSLSSSLALLVNGGGLIGEVLLSIDMSLRKRRSWGQSRCRLHMWGIVGERRWRHC